MYWVIDNSQNYNVFLQLRVLYIILVSSLKHCTCLICKTYCSFELFCFLKFVYFIFKSDVYYFSECALCVCKVKAW